ncbi:MAG: response regulator transcription factor [Pedobacter sp.]|nr:MAG: response regulator transcription factor [Pedobacter sp.]
MDNHPLQRIFIVDDHQLVIEGMRSLLADAPHYSISGFTHLPMQVLELLDENPTDILLTDISMPLMSGIELTRLVKKRFPNIKVIAISMHGERAVVKEMLEAGIAGYLLKNTGRGELIEALDRVRSGGTYFGEEVTREILNSFTSRDQEQRLTNREIEIIKLINEEYGNKQISNKLFISERTVETHRKNIFRKTNTQSVIGLLKYAAHHKYI